MINTKELLEMQSRVNLSYDYPIKQDFEVAAIVEAGELIDHLGYKWWSNSKVDLDQAFLEVVDILHFSLCIILRDSPDEEVKLNLTTSGNFKVNEPNQNQIIDATVELLDELIHYRYANKSVFSPGYVDILTSLCDVAYSIEGDGWQKKLLSTFTGKNALNIFRMGNGYGNGEYNKVADWFGTGEAVEDNVLLARLIDDKEIVELNEYLEALEGHYEAIR
jgi:dimeric dUTPase (all-alpha-NTP-PPase superfamily)